MRLDPKSSIARLPVLQVRDALRALRFSESFRLRYLARKLKAPDEQAQLVIAELMKLGYAQQDASATDEYRLTSKGRQFMLASGRRGVSREAAVKMLDEFMSRVASVNDNPGFVFRVTEVCVLAAF